MKITTFSLFVALCFFNIGLHAQRKSIKSSVKKTTTVSTKGPSVSRAKSIDPLFNTDSKPIPLVPQAIKLKKGLSFNLNIPKGYGISVAYEGLNRLRFLTPAPDGRLFATDMFNRSDNKKGKVYILENWDEKAKRFKNIKTYLSGLHNPNQVAFFKENDIQYIYVSETGKLTRYVYQKGDNMPRDKGQIVTTFPDYGLSYKYGGWHLTRSITFHNGKLYVSVGSSCNACVEKEAIRATVMEMNPDGTDKKYYARGLRNSVAIKFVYGKMWGTSMGRDLIGPDKPEDMFHTIEPETYYGFPFYYQYKGKIIPDPQFKDSLRAKWVKTPPVAFCGFKAHSAPLGFDFMKDFNDPMLKNSFLVALHGSTSVWRERGNAIVKACGTNSYVEVVSGFLPKGKTKKVDADRMGRPCDVMMRDKNSFWITDDLHGVLYLVYKK
jgi:glucose/arabinose dehydrogenase